MTSDHRSGVEVVAFQPAAPIDYDDVTRPFWEALEEGKLRIQRCSRCGTFKSPPTLYCWNCLSIDNDWVDLSGRARLYTYTVVPLDRASAESRVYVPALVCPVEASDTKIFCNIVECEVGDLRVGMDLQFALELNRNDIVLFRPSGAAREGAEP